MDYMHFIDQLNSVSARSLGQKVNRPATSP